jgi:hypothetical protein
VKDAARELTQSPGTAIVSLIDKIFTLGVLFGAGDHWPLEKPEKEEWIKDFDVYYKTVKAPALKKTLETIQRVAPGVALITTSALIVGSRGVQSYKNLQRKRAAARERARAEAMAGEVLTPVGTPGATNGPIRTSSGAFRAEAGEQSGAHYENSPGAPAGPGEPAHGHAEPSRVPRTPGTDRLSAVRAARVHSLFTGSQRPTS